MRAWSSLDRSQVSDAVTRLTRRGVMRGRREPPRSRREDRQNFVLSEYNKPAEVTCTWVRAAQA
jgi:hypothetical protein